MKPTNYTSAAHTKYLMRYHHTLNKRQNKSCNRNYVFPTSNKSWIPQEHRKQMTPLHTKQNTFLAYFVVSSATWNFTFSQLNLLKQFGIIFAKNTPKLHYKLRINYHSIPCMIPLFNLESALIVITSLSDYKQHFHTYTGHQSEYFIETVSTAF